MAKFPKGACIFNGSWIIPDVDDTTEYDDSFQEIKHAPEVAADKRVMLKSVQPKVGMKLERHPRIDFFLPMEIVAVGRNGVCTTNCVNKLMFIKLDDYGDYEVVE
jgi:hypothetical protein